MSFPASSPNSFHHLPPRPSVESPPRNFRAEHSYTASTMNSYPYPSHFNFNTASVAIARERAGNRARPAPRGQRPLQIDDRQDPSVSKHHGSSLSPPCFLASNLLLLHHPPRIFTATHVQTLTLLLQLRSNPSRPRREQDRRRGRYP